MSTAPRALATTSTGGSITATDSRPRRRSWSAICSVPTTSGMSSGRNGATAIDITVATAGTPSRARGPK